MADNRYYYFKDAKGNRHTVDKTAYDKDPMGFAKAFPGARMEVIDRKTGRRGDVSVKDASRVGDFGAHLFTGRTITRGKGKPNSSALGRAQQSVAQEKWGGGVVTHENTTTSENVSAPKRNAVTLDDWNGGTTGKESELVKGLRAADMIRKRDEEQMPIDYTKPGAVKQMVGGVRRAQKSLERRMEQAGQEAGRNAEGEIRRRNAPAFDLGNEDVNNNIVKTRGQLEDELEESSRQLVDKQLGGYINNSIQKMFKDATVKGVAAEDALSKASPFAYMAAGKAYNEALDPDKLMNQLSKNAEKDMAGLFSDPKMQKEIAEKAASLGIDPEDYVKNYIAPGLQAKIAEEFEKSELSRNMPKSTAEYIIRGVNDSMIGTILSMGMMSKKQRQYAQQGMAMTDNGENPYVKPGMGARVARGTLGFGADGPVFGVLGKGGAWVAGKAFGNGVAQAARIANTSLAGRIGRMVGTGAVSQGVTGVLYGSTNAAVQNYSTGDDTSIGNTVKLMTMGGLSEGASWATMGGIGGAVGAGIYNVSGVKRIPAKVFQIAMEGWGMHVGGNVAKMIEGHDTDFWSVEGTLEACANVVALKLTHARLPKRQVNDGKKEGYLDMVARNIKNLMTSDGQRATFGGYVFTNEEKEQLFGSDKAPKREETLYGYDVHDNPLTRKESLTSWAMRTKKTAAKGKGEESYKDTDTEFVKTAYDEIMADETIPWDTKAKFSALVMGTVPSARPMMDHIAIERDERGAYVGEYSLYGELLSKNRYKTADEYVSIKYNLGAKKENQRLSNAYGAAQIKDEKAAQETLETVAETFGFTAEQLKAAMDKDPLKRSEEEQNACVALRKAYEGEQFPEGTLHPDQSQTEGKDVVEENNLGTENPNNEAVAEVLNNMNNAEKAFNAALESNDVLKQEYERLTKEGLSEPQIYMELINSGLTQEQLVPFADYINTKAKAVGMYRGTEQKIAETVQKHVEQWSYKGEQNGEKQEGGQMLFVKDNNGRLLIVGAGDVAFDNEGRARESVGDMLSVLDPNTKEMDFVSKKDVQLDHVEKTEDYAKAYQTKLEELNSGAYAESEKGKEKSEESDTKTESVVTPKEGASAPGVEDVKPIGEGEKKNPSDNGNGSNETLTFADGSPVPMMKDTKGRETADYSQMTPEHGAEWMSSQFGENAEAAVDGQIKRAEKMLKEAEMIKVDYTGDLNDAKEAEAQKAKAVDAAKAELELYTNIKKVMTANKVKAGMEKVGSVGEEGSVSEAGNLGAVREKFESGKRIVGNKRTRTLADGSKLRGHYEIVEADSLTPSHNANDGYKKSEGFPVNEEGRTINDRDYENDKQAQMVTDMIAMKYDGQAVDQVPVVTSDGIVVDGNGRTMAGQKAAKNGTDSAYLEALKENAENYGFTAEQIEQSGIKHPRLVLVSDEPMKYDTATFAKFNKNEKKSQGNTQQAVANSKKLSADEIGTIISEIEGSGSLDAFFNNPTAINSLLKRLIDKGVIGLNEIAGLREGEDKLSAAGKDFVKNLLLGSVFSENTIRMMGADAMLKTKALNGIRAVTDNMKLGDYALMKEIDQAVQLLYEARQGGSGVDAYLRTPAMFGENAADRFDPISQAIALALEGKAEDFRELMMAYNRNAAPYADANQMEMFGERPTNEEFIKEFLKLRNWKDYETRHSSKEGNGDAGSSEGTEPQAPGGDEPTEGQREVDKAEEEKSDKPHEASLALTEPVEPVEPTKPKGEEREGELPRTKEIEGDLAPQNKFKAYIESRDQGLKQVSPVAKALKEAVESGDKKRIKNAQKDLVEAILASPLGHGYLSSYLSICKNTKKNDKSYNVNKALIKPLTEVIKTIESALDSALKDAGLEGVHLSYGENGDGWIYADKNSPWYAQLKALDNDYRNISQIKENDPIAKLPQITLDNVADAARIIKSVIEEGERYNEYTEKEELNKEPLSILPKKEENTLNPIVKAAENYKKDHPLTEGEIRGSDVADKVLADWAKGANPLKSEKGKEKSEKSDTKVEGEEPPKTNPLAWLAHTAEMFKDEQIQKARKELTAAKESGDASDIKRATEKMKQAMETKLRGNGIGLVERRRIIGRELGKILGKEVGKAEAEKVNKPWEQMDLEEREAVSSKNPLTETEINELTSKENRELIPAALAYLRGDKGNIINAISYFKIWNDVRSRHENVPDNSGTKDGTQLDVPNTGGSQELGLGRGRKGGGPDGPVDRTDSERTTPGERESGTGGENDTPVSTGKPRVDKGEGNTPGMDAVSAGSTDTRGGGGAGNEGNVPKRGGQGGGNGPLDPNAGRKPAAKQGTHFPNSTSERLKQERAEYEQKKKDFWERWKKAGQGYVKIALTPFKKLNLSPEQIEMLPELFKMHLNGAVLKIKEGIYKFNEWKAAMRAEEGEELKMIGLSDDDVDRFIEDYWNTPYQMDGETHTIGEWAGIHGNEELRNKLSEPLNDKYQRQMDAEPIKVKIGDKKNIEETLPYLLPQQQEDVLKAETQFFGNEHADREHAYGKGYMFTNGTGTGKTFTGLGIAKRLVKQGKGRILIVTPSQKKVSDWIKDGRNLNMEIRDLDSIAKERGTTATTESGEGVVITTFANFGVNKKLLEENWDAVIYDESHRIMENKKGADTARSIQHYMVTNRDERHCFLRLQETNKDYQKMKSLGEQFDAEREKEVERIRKEYKVSHPSATASDVAYAIRRMLPKDIQSFREYADYPKLGKIHAEYVNAVRHYNSIVEPKLKAQAKAEWKDTKTIFLSATPFNTRENLDYVEGYIFKYPEVEKGGRISGRTQFYLDNFGSAYKFRYNRLEQSTSNPEAVAKQEIAFSDYLQDTLGTMSGRIIDSPYDYSRDFPTVSPDHAEQFNQAVQDAVRGHGVLADAYRRTIGDYNYGSALFETMKVANIIERIKAHLDAGRKVVIFHRRVETKEPLKPPFALMLEQANHLVSIMSEGKDKKEAAQAVRDFRKKYADLLKWEQTLDYSMPREQIAKVFGKDNVLFFSGKESSKVKDKAVDIFNDDNSGKNIIVIQEASGKEGISLHDKTGEHQRVCITLALPQSPITALQIEGRTYRIGNKSNAIFEYPILGLNSEMMLFGQKFNNQVSTTENLALGSQARSLRDSFANGILEHSGVVPIDQQGVGGKEFDAPKDQSTDGFDNAVLDYYSNQKLNSRNREGVDYFPTPEPLGYKMMEWANMGEGDTVMEPSAGHGAIARYAPKGNQMVAIEPSQSLFAKLQLKAGGLGRKFVNTIFENYDISNKHDVVVMNPPFGTAGATAIAHLGKAFKHLEEGGRVVAIIPRGSTDKKFEKWINGEKTAVMRAEVELPDIVFKQAGTNVVCRVVVVDKISNEAMRAKAGSVEKVNLGGHYDKIEDFFEDLRDIEMPDRIIDTNTIMQKKSKQTAKDLKELKDVTVNLNEHGINVHVRGDRNDYSIMFDLGEYNAEQRKSILSGTYERFEEYERYTRDETSQAVIAELKKLTCKLAGMTEEEMQRYLKKQNDGKGVMYRMEHAAEVYGKANAHYRMELGDTFSDSKEHFDAVRDRAVEEKGIVMPNLNKEKVKVVEVEKSPFGDNIETSLKNAREWAKENLVTTGKTEMPIMRDGTSYTISKRAVEKYLSESAVRKSENLDIHLSVLPKLTDVIHESIEAEIHADYNVKDETGKRKAELGYGNNILVHRLYGAVEMDGKIYRVKTTMQEFRGGEENKPHSYEVTKIELLDSPGKRENPDRPPSDASNNSIDNKIELPDAPGTAVLPDSSPLDTTPSNSKNITSEGSEKANESDSLPLNSTTNGYISTAKLLQGVEKSYDSGKKLLDESKNLTDGETFFRKEGDGVVTPEKTSGTSNAVSERIIKTVEKVAKRTGGKVKMVNSVEEIENPKVRKDIENGKQVTGWYDEKTGEVHLYMPNIHDSYTAEKTVWHETVGHKGMRGLLGDKFNDYMRSLWMDLDNPINAELRAYVKEKMNMNHLGFYDAIEEFIAKSAEDGKGEPGFWNYIKNKVTDALHEIGYRVSPNVKDVKYMLWLAKNVQKHGDSPLWKMRAEAVRWKIEHEKTLSVVEENGMMYDNNGKKHGLLDLNKKDFDEATDGHVHYRTSPMTASKIEEYNRRLSTKWYAFKESTVDDMQSLQEAMQIISGVKDAYADIPSAFNPLQCHNRMGSMVMQMCERYDREYTEPLGDAFKKVVSAMPGKDGAEQTRNANLYFIKKHGLERNRVLFVRDKIREERKVKSEESDSIDALETAWKGERSDLRQKLDSGQIDLREYYRQMDEWIVQNLDKDFKAEEHDYSGMHGIYDVKKGEEYDDANVIDEVMSTESQLGADLVKSFWDAKKKATDFTIDQVYANGFMDKNGRDHLKEMFDWYVPLRKFDDTVAEDVYGYISGSDTKNYIGSVIEKARGRESLSDVNVLAQISALAKSSILNGGKNVEKQHFMRFVEAYEKGDAKDRIFVEIQPWVEKHTVDGNEVWEEVMPNIPENSTQEQINDILNTFEDTMKAKQAHGEAKIARRKSDIGYKFERSSDMNQHIVNVYVNGRVRRFVCQGNPRAAQAINGLLRDSGTQHWATEQSAKLNRYCAQLNTSLNPDFVSSNLVRDLTAGSANLVVKEGMGYTWDFCMEYAKNWGSMVRRKDGGFDGGYLGMFRRYKDGRLDANNQKERWFKEFMDNGGETGFVSLKKYEDIIKEYENLVKTGNKEGDRWLMKKLKEGGAFIELANEVVENVARYSTYCVSRKRGRSIGKSIYDAKEVSSNFNRHGSGDAIKSLKTGYDGKTDTAFRKPVGWFNSWMKNHTMFYNAGVQGANLFAKNLYNNTKTTAIAFGAMPFGLSLAVALFNLWRIGREDEKKRNGVKNPYAELPEWKRRNNICIYWGGGKFKTIPMGIELRAFYGLGDIAAGYVVDESLKSDVQIGWDIIGQMAQLVPASDFLGHHSPSSGIKELGEDVALSVIPTIAKPEFELAFNRDWTGRPIYRDKDYLDKAPRWKRAYDSTNDVYMTINKWANKTFNGIDSTNEDLKGSGMMADAVDFFTAPYGLQHIVEGYTGGTGATIGRMYQTGKSFAKGVVSGIKDDKGFAEGFNKEWDKVDPNTIPFYRVFNYTPKEGNDMQRTKSKWYNYADELERLKYNMQQMKTNTPDTAKNIHNAATKFKLSQSKDGRKLKIYEAADRYIAAKRRILKRAKDKAVVEAVNEAINRKMQEAVEDLDRIE
jgi:predicted RNA methylase